MRRRAERHGETFTVARRDPAGTALSWSVPIDDGHDYGSPAS